MRMGRAAVPKSVVVPCERCGTNITIYEGDWTRSCYSCTCIETGCNRPGVFKDDDYAGYDCRYHNHDNQYNREAKYCQWPYITQHVTLPGLWSDNGSPHANWYENYCPEHACKNALALGKGYTGKSADGIDYCLACDAFYGDSEAPASLTATPEGGWLRRNNTVTFSATDKSTPIEYRVLNSSGTVVRDWSATASASLGNDTYSLYAREAKGNVSAAKSFTVANVDTSAPNKPALSKSPTAAWSETNVTVTITHGADNGVSGVARTEYSTNGGSTWATYSSAVTLSSTTTVLARTVDNAGNVSAKATLEVDTSLLDDGNPGSKPGGNNPNGGSTGNGNPGGGNPGTGMPNGSNPGGGANGGLPNTGNPGGGANGLPNTGNPDGNGPGGNPVDGNSVQPFSFQEQPEDGSETDNGSPSTEDGKVKYIVIGSEDGQPQKLYETTYYLPTIKIPVMDGMDAEEICALVEAALKAAMPTNTSGSGGCGEHCICCRCMQQRCGQAGQEAAGTEAGFMIHWQTVLVVLLILLVICLLLYSLFHRMNSSEK